MKKVYLSIILICLFGKITFAQTGGNQSNDWKEKLTGVWMVDSVLAGHKKLGGILDGDKAKHQYYSFSKNNIIVLSTENESFLRDSFSLSTLNGNKVVVNKINYMEVKEVGDKQLVLEMTEQGTNRARRQTTLTYLNRQNQKDLFPDLKGAWSGRASSGFGRFNEKNSNMIELTKDFKVNLRINNITETGNWMPDPENFAITLTLPSGTYTSYIISKEYQRLEITNPFFSDEYLDFASDDKPTIELYNDNNNGGKMEVISEMPREFMISDSTPDSKIYKKWDAIKELSGKDSLAPDKSISVLFLKDNKFTITINNKKTSGTFSVKNQNNTIVFKTKGKEILCLFRFENQPTGFIEKSNSFSGTQLLLTMQLPGDEKVRTYLFN